MGEIARNVYLPFPLSQAAHSCVHPYITFPIIHVGCVIVLLDHPIVDVLENVFDKLLENAGPIDDVLLVNLGNLRFFRHFAQTLGQALQNALMMFETFLLSFQRGIGKFVVGKDVGVFQHATTFAQLLIGVLEESEIAFATTTAVVAGDCGSFFVLLGGGRVLVTFGSRRFLVWFDAASTIFPFVHFLELLASKLLRLRMTMIALIIMQIAFEFVLGPCLVGICVTFLIGVTIPNVMRPHTDPTKSVPTLAASHIHAPAILLNARGTFGTRLGVGRNPIGRFRLVVVLLVPLRQYFARDGNVRFLATSNAKTEVTGIAVGNFVLFVDKSLGLIDTVGDPLAALAGTPSCQVVGIDK